MNANERQQQESVRILYSSASKLKQKLQDLLVTLQTQCDSCDWPKYLNTLGLCASELVEIRKVLETERFSLAQSLVLTPVRLNPEPDPALAKATDERLPRFDHDTAPQYLRTKLAPQVESQRMAQNAKASAILPEQATKLVNLSNRLLDSGLKEVNALKQELEMDLSEKTFKSSVNPDDLFTLVAAITTGANLSGKPAPQDTCK
uniref:Mediator of RNA polymerase II transcription subunit 8 n=1 Tax=Schistocephalus solidus TaxID=70667 RepID=A0A0X3P6B3_SCHSO